MSRIHAARTTVTLLKVVAEDRGKPVNRASAEVIIQIEDVNDCSPKFSLQQYHFAVEEDDETHRREHRRVGNVLATDSDIGTNAQIRYHIEERDTPFEVS